MIRRTALFASVLAMLLLPACATNPVTGERQLALISEAQEVDMGRGAAEQVEQTIGLVDDVELQRYVSRIGEGLAADSERPGLPWRFGVVDDPTPNAFALPGGFIYLTRGMMALLNSEAELASVLGHEIGHVTARHSVSALSRQQLAQLGLGLGGVLVPELQPYGQVLNMGLDLLLLRNSRDAERQADDLGFRYALEEGYDVREMADVFTGLQRLAQAGAGALPTWLATHPDPGDRVDAVAARVAALAPGQIGGRVAAADYLRQVDGLVYGEDPRNGFFDRDDNAFVHPGLRFVFGLPSRWKGQNLSRAVLGASPNGDAALQLTLAGDTSPGQALRAFGAQSGIRVTGASEERINGIPAVVARFDAGTQSGVISGLIGWYGYEGRTYQLVIYTEASAYPRWDAQFRQVLGSFSELRDPEALAVEPLRLDVVPINRDVTLAAFADDAPVKLEVLAVLNKLEGPNAVLSAGSLAKRIVE